MVPCCSKVVKGELGLPKSQNAVQTRGSAPLNRAASRAPYIAQDDAGEPGSGSILPVENTVFGKAAHEGGCRTHGPRALRST